ncbi:MAG: hypothetical protein FD176_1204 [Rhodospirillaceae bacterium]|nr:MAG: hypothetical protein FD176_1204 [Rhodospirillaceae bacterium]TNC94178.1 MAG: paaI [Stygiobacter sp.]
MTDAAKRQKIAHLVLDHMYPKDHNAHAMGITIDEIRPGYARASMVVRREMLNGHGSLHGGMSYALADTAFAYACNSYNTNAVAAGCSIVYPAAGREGDKLTAEAVETHLTGRNGVYDVTVSNQDGDVIALFRGQSRMVSGTVVPSEEIAKHV